MSFSEPTYRNKLRVRVCGLLVQADAVLLAQLHSPVTENLVWIPPGGGLQFGEQMEDCLNREFAEETNIDIAVHDLVHINELVEPPYHGIEFYFEVEQTGGELDIGLDPELSWDHQLIRDLAWIPMDELKEVNLAPQNLCPKLLDWQYRSSFNVFPKR